MLQEMPSDVDASCQLGRRASLNDCNPAHLYAGQSFLHEIILILKRKRDSGIGVFL